MAAATPSLPPIPPQGPDAPAPENTGGPSAFGGGQPAMMQAIAQTEGGLKSLAIQLPSLAPMIADFISKLRTAVPTAAGSGADSVPPGSPAITGGQSLPSPPQQGAQ